MGDATNIVGVHGAGMMNMIMMPHGSNYTEIAGMSGEAGGRCPNWTILCALAAGHSVRGIAGKIDRLGCPIFDLDRLEAQLLASS